MLAMNTIVEQNDLSEKRHHSVDFIKGICIIFVIVTHYSWENSERLAFLFPFWIDMAVPVFMIISGFVYAESFQKQAFTQLCQTYYLQSIMRRIVRYTVPFVFAFVVEEVVYTSLGVVQHSLNDIWVVFLRGGFGPGSYYFPIMIQFIFFFPIIYYIVHLKGLYGVVILGACNFGFEVLRHAYAMNEECYRLLLFRYIICIAYGAYLATGERRRHIWLSGLCVFVGVFYIIICVYFGYIPPITYYWTGTSIWACLFIIPLIGPLLTWPRVKNRFIELLGRASYDIFLVQMVYFNGAKYIYSHIPNRVLQLLANFLICISAGVVFYFIEKPITKKIYNSFIHTM